MLRSIAGLRTRIEAKEGRRRRTYRDGLGNPTIGVGHLLLPGELERWPLGASSDQLTDAQVDAILTDDLGKAMNQVVAALPWASDLDDDRLGVLVEMAFNMGIGSHEQNTGLLGFRRFLGAVKAGDFHQAAVYLGQSPLWRRQVNDPPGNAGSNRVDALAAIIEGGNA